MYFAGLKNDQKYYTRVKTNLSSLWGPVRSFTTQGAITARSRTEIPVSSEDIDIETFDIHVFPNPFED
jgi:hypothetical protein